MRWIRKNMEAERKLRTIIKGIVQPDKAKHQKQNTSVNLRCYLHSYLRSFVLRNKHFD